MHSRLLSIVALASVATFGLISCEQRECTSPPPQYQFAFVTAQGQPLVTDSLQAKTVRLAYTSTSGSKMIVPQNQFRPIPTTTPYRYVYQLSHELIGSEAQPRQYAIELNEQPVGTLRLMAQQRNTKCDKWMHLTEVQANQKVVSVGADNVTYQITIDR